MWTVTVRPSVVGNERYSINILWGGQVPMWDWKYSKTLKAPKGPSKTSTEIGVGGGRERIIAHVNIYLSYHPSNIKKNFDSGWWSIKCQLIRTRLIWVSKSWFRYWQNIHPWIAYSFQGFNVGWMRMCLCEIIPFFFLMIVLKTPIQFESYWRKLGPVMSDFTMWMASMSDGLGFLTHDLNIHFSRA